MEKKFRHENSLLPLLLLLLLLLPLLLLLLLPLLSLFFEARLARSRRSSGGGGSSTNERDPKRQGLGIGASIIEAVEEIVIAAIRVWRHTSAHRKSHPSLIGSDRGEGKNAATAAGAKKFSNPFTRNLSGQPSANVVGN